MRASFERTIGRVCHRRRARGFTLVELMVGLTLSVIVVFALITLFVNNSRVRSEIDQAAQQIENGRYAVEAIRDDLHLAGYYGGVMPQAGYSVAAAAVPTIAEICTSTLASLHFTLSPLSWPVPVFGVASGDPVPACVSGATGGFKAGTEILVVRRTSTVPVPSKGSLVADQIYVQGAGCKTDLAQHKDFAVDLGNGAFPLTKKGCADAADIYRFETRIYYVSDEAIPTLRVLTLSGGATTNEPLIEGIQDMRVEFGRDTNGDGAPDEFRKCKLGGGGGDPCTTAEWANMVAVRVHLLARNIATSVGYQDTKTYTLGRTTVGPFNDAYKRHEYSAVVRLFNPAGSRER